MGKLYKHYTDYCGPWPWDHFTPREIACKHCGELYLDEEAMDALEELRSLWAHPIVVNSAHRCPVHNRNVGGKDSSQHLKIAFDCLCPRDQQSSFIKSAREAGFTGLGRYPGKGFVHVDTGPRRAWQG